MTHEELSRLQDIISSTENGQGATYWNDLTTQPTTGYVVAVRQIQGCHGLSGALYALCYAIEHNLYFGVWRDDEGVVYYDACHVYDTQAKAEADAVLNDQMAYYHIDTGEVIFTDVKEALSQTYRFLRQCAIRGLSFEEAFSLLQEVHPRHVPYSGEIHAAFGLPYLFDHFDENANKLGAMYGPNVGHFFYARRDGIIRTRILTGPALSALGCTLPDSGLTRGNYVSIQVDVAEQIAYIHARKMFTGAEAVSKLVAAVISDGMPDFIKYRLSKHGFFVKPDGRRSILSNGSVEVRFKKRAVFVSPVSKPLPDGYDPKSSMDFMEISAKISQLQTQ